MPDKVNCNDEGAEYNYKAVKQAAGSTINSDKISRNVIPGRSTAKTWSPKEQEEN